MKTLPNIINSFLNVLNVKVVLKLLSTIRNIHISPIINNHLTESVQIYSGLKNFLLNTILQIHISFAYFF
jgi:hypothetical protein